MAVKEEFFKYLGSYDAPWLGTLRDSLAGEPSVAVRMNVRKAGDRHPLTAIGVPWCRDGYRLDTRPAFTFDPAMHQGVYYVQDASSMFISHVMRELCRQYAGPVSVLDACAAPGGKTTAIIDAVPYGSLVVANEFVPRRASVLRENLAKWGYPYAVVTQGDTARFAGTPSWFDIVAADVPCSGEGMMRKDDEAAGQWSPQLVEQCAVRQKEILHNIWPALKPGGFMIYSTCTFNVEENEAILRFMRDTLGAEPVSVDVEGYWGIARELCGDMPAYRFIPGLVHGEGLFMAVVRKPADAGISLRLPKKDKSQRRPGRNGKASGQDVVPEIRKWLVNPEEFDFSVSGDAVVIRPKKVAGMYVPELEIASLKGRGYVPTQQLAMSDVLNINAFAVAEVSREQAIDYLRCESAVLPEGTPRGIVLLMYGGNPLGFVKNLGNRANNLYPKQWRILSARPAVLPDAVL